VRIDAYSFGHICIDGVDYSKDVIVFGEAVLTPWWRESGHVFDIDDLKDVMSINPATVVLGTGFFGRVRVPRTTISALEEAGWEVLALRTGQAVVEFNRHVDAGRAVVAALHLTC
jgi:hypothetical protein